MRRRVLNKSLAVLLIAAVAYGAPAAARAESFKVGYVDATKVFEESPQYKVARDALKAEFTRRENDLLARQKELKKLEDDYNRDSAVMSESKRQDMERELISLRRKLKNRQNEEFNTLRRQVSEVVREVGKGDGYDLILTDGVVYHSKRVDISDKVLDRLRDKSR